MSLWNESSTTARESIRDPLIPSEAHQNEALDDDIEQRRFRRGKGRSEELRRYGTVPIDRRIERASCSTGPNTSYDTVGPPQNGSITPTIELPEEIWITVLSFLPLKTILNCARVDRSLYHLHFSPRLWMELLRRDFNTGIFNGPTVNRNYGTPQNLRMQDSRERLEEHTESIFVPVFYHSEDERCLPSTPEDREYWLRQRTKNNFYFKVYCNKYRKRAERLEQVRHWRSRLVKHANRVSCCVWSRFIGDIHQLCCVPCALSVIPLLTLILLCYKLEDVDAFSWMSVLVPLFVISGLVVTGALQASLCAPYRSLSEHLLFPFDPETALIRLQRLQWHAESQTLCGDAVQRISCDGLRVALHVSSLVSLIATTIVLTLKALIYKQLLWTFALLPAFMTWILIPTSLTMIYHNPESSTSLWMALLMRLGVRRPKNALSCLPEIK
eukprot:gb/GECG01008640.1/.p1 GENE.gb/GECG01008640.1/~~gb/GECG01008640.1/.p1  ORF type:complete len:442 (+),score=21.04 gb/GECG01008640.1/:1-1326(+)